MTTKTKTIEGKNFEISQPYEAGHTITDIEARVLNQTRSENIGNNIRAKLKEAIAAGATDDALAQLVAELDATYVFTAAGTRAAAKLDPYEKEARSMAMKMIKSKLAETGRKFDVAPDGYTPEEWKEYLETKVDEVATNPVVIEGAKKTVDAKRKAADKLQEALGDTTL